MGLIMSLLGSGRSFSLAQKIKLAGAVLGVVIGILATCLYRRHPALAALFLLVIAGVGGKWFWEFGHGAFGFPRLKPLPTLTSSPRQPGSVRVVCISDTHNLHNNVRLPEGDILVHAGDFTYKGTHAELISFNEWLGKQPFKHKIVVSGNHDLSLDASFYNDHWAEWHTKFHDPEKSRKILTNCTYLCDEEVTVMGLRIYASPYQPRGPAHLMAWNYESEAEAEKVWTRIPNGLDILLTHGPPKGIGDKMLLGMNVGCPSLLNAVLRARPRFHVFGHIHESFGVYKGKETTFVNAAVSTVTYTASHEPIVFDIVPRGEHQ